MTDTMQFRDFIFRHNPQTIAVSCAANVVPHFCPGKGDVVQNLGRRGRIVRCSGSFFGTSFREAMAQLTEFRQKTNETTGGMLFIPGVEPFMAQLREFAFDAQGDGRIIGYTMVFVEAQVAV